MKRREFLAASVASYVAALSMHSLGYSQPLLRQRRKYQSWSSDNIFLQGINAPVFQEVDIEPLNVVGEIPPDLEGVYIRNGPNPTFRPLTYNYPLEGDGMLHAIAFSGSKARYRNRWIETKGLVYEMAAGKALPELRFRNYANTNIIEHAGVLLALYEMGLPYQITPDLKTAGEWNFNGGIEQSMTAHPRFDPQTGELHFYRYSFFTEPFLTYYIADAKGKVIRKQPINLPRSALLHDMALTENYAVFFHCPLEFDMQQAMECGIPFVWRPEYNTRIGLIHRHARQQEPLWIETEPFWAWHFVNAFETDRQLTIDFVRYPQLTLKNTLNAIVMNRSNLQRMTVDLKTKTVKQRSLDDRTVDFPTIARNQTGKPYRFAYTPYFDLKLVAQKGIPNYCPELIQYDMVNQTSKVYRFKSGCYGGEAVVVPKLNSSSEADSYVMTWVYDEKQQNSSLAILDAAHFDQEPIAQIHLPIRVPMGSHGNWFPSYRWSCR